MGQLRAGHQSGEQVETAEGDRQETGPSVRCDPCSQIQEAGLDEAAQRRKLSENIKTNEILFKKVLQNSFLHEKTFTQ